MGNESLNLRATSSGQAILVDAAANVYVSGGFRDTVDFGPIELTSVGDQDGFLMKLDSQGVVQWATGWGGSGNDAASTLAFTADGNLVVAGINIADGVYTTSIRKIESNDGASVWAKSIDASAYGLSPRIAVDSEGSLFFTSGFGGSSTDVDPGPGEHLITNVGTMTTYLLKLSSEADFLWARTLETYHTTVYAHSKPNDLAVDSSGNVILSGFYRGVIDFDPSATGYYQLPEQIGSDAGLFVEKFSNDGDFIWVQQTPVSDVIEVDAADNIYAFADSVIKLDSAGNLKWAAPLTEGVTNAKATAAVVDSLNRVYVSGNFSVSTVDFDPGAGEQVLTATKNRGFLLASNPVAGDQNTGIPLELFNDSFEVGEWNGLWVEDTQNDWFRSNQRATIGGYSAEVDGSANNATMTTANVIDLSGMASATLTFDWLIESGFDSGEYLAIDISTNGGSSWTQDVRRLNGNVSAENVWHSETVDLTPYKSADLKVRFRSKVSASDEDANVDNVRIVGIADGPNTAPVAVVGGPYSVNEGDSVVLSGAASSDPDGSIASYAWDFDNDGQYDDASGVSVNFSTTVSGLHTVGLQVTDNRGATAVTSTTVTVNNVAPTANAGSDVNGFVGTPVSLSATGSTDPGYDIVSYAWDLDNDGQYDDASGVNATFSAAAAGTYIVSVLVTDADGATSTDSATITLSTISVTSTKFYVVDDGSPDRTYEYGATGNAIENYAINSGNSRPRGAASNAAGDTVWVADRNRKVYVYDTSGSLLGSWAAGTLASTASVEGIATNGTDVWIIDSRSDKVFRYANAAGRTSGSQSAVSSFALNSSNRSPKGIVTDGNYFWIIDSSTTDKVFKYTVSGSLVGSWTIDSANNSPTGLTIDPTGASQSIWIVDSGTDKVYEYTDALGKSSGSLSAANTFALAAGNTNPQGIADPPPVGSPVSSTRLATARPISQVAPAVVGNQTSSIASGIADDNQRRSLTRVDRPALRWTLQPAVSQSQDQGTLSDANAQIELSKADRSVAKREDDREDHFFLDDSFEWVDEALLSLLEQK